MSSILTNNSAMVALQTLKGINKDLSETQSSISTGKDIAQAKDNSAIWAISKVMESDVSGFNAVADSLALGESTVAVASAGAEQITNLLNDIKEKVVAATGENVDYTKLTADVTELTSQGLWSWLPQNLVINSVMEWCGRSGEGMSIATPIAVLRG